METENRPDFVVISGSWGELEVDPETGEVLYYYPRYYDADALEGEDYNKIARLDVQEWRETYPNREMAGDTVHDILDWGYWTVDGVYEPPCESYRMDLKLSMAENE